MNIDIPYKSIYLQLINHYAANMKISSILIVLALTCFILSSCGTGSKHSSATASDTSIASLITGKYFDSCMRILASDSFEGRKPFTTGEEKTVHYLEEQYKSLGLLPGNGNSYFQEVPLVEIKAVPSGNLVFKGKRGSVSLSYLDDYVCATRRIQNQVNINDAQIVFAGYGIVAPEFGWNDYAGLDAKGKIVMVMVNDPGFFDSSLFKGKTMTYYGRWTYKFEEAARQGAAGVIIVHDTKPASYGWSVIRNSFSKSKLYLQAEDGNMSRAGMEGWVTMESAKKIFALAGKPESLMLAAGRKGFKPVSLDLNGSVTINSTFKKSTSKNVLAILPGRDRKDEYVIYSAHWDHFGKGEAVKGDSIYNGAADNASGTAALLEIAKAFTQLENKPHRSVLFLSVTAEEQGLLGSEYYGTHPVYPVNKTVADINIDILQPFGKMKDVIVIGKGQSDLDGYIEAAAKKQGRYTREEPDPSGGWYFRSDHFNFAKTGIPALYIENGTESTLHGEAWGQAQKEAYIANRYHSPADEYSSAWDLSSIIQDMQLLFEVGYTLCNESTFPKWKPGSEFKAIREKSRR